jgi:hypothetical protein
MLSSHRYKISYIVILTRLFHEASMTESSMNGEQLVWWELEGETEVLGGMSTSDSILSAETRREDKATVRFYREVTIHICE